jgi:TPP-dependent pyruvate/acetoin dehydrogenase alpha subunit
MHSLKVGGQDVEAVYHAAREAITQTRVGSEPVFLLCEAGRLTRNAGRRATRRNLRDMLELSSEGWARHAAEAQAVVGSIHRADPSQSDALTFVYAGQRAAYRQSRRRRRR